MIVKVVFEDKVHVEINDPTQRAKPAAVQKLLDVIAGTFVDADAGSLQASTERVVGFSIPEIEEEEVEDDEDLGDG